MCIVVKELANITMISDSRTLGASFGSFWKTSRGPLDIGSAVAHMGQGHSAFVLVIRKRPGINSGETYKARSKVPDKYWFNVTTICYASS